MPTLPHFNELNLYLINLVGATQLGELLAPSTEPTSFEVC